MTAMYPLGGSVYIWSVTKRLVDIDDELLDRAKVSAGTKTVKATVEAGLRGLVDRDESLRHIRWLRRPGSLDPKALATARDPRFGPSS
jgi:Arc/MetJ family transcription regulator